MKSAPYCTGTGSFRVAQIPVPIVRWPTGAAIHPFVTRIAVAYPGATITTPELFSMTIIGIRTQWPYHTRTYLATRCWGPITGVCARRWCAFQYIFESTHVWIIRLPHVGYFIGCEVIIEIYTTMKQAKSQSTPKPKQKHTRQKRKVQPLHMITIAL